MLIGREHERHRLAQLVTTVRAGRSQALVLVGDPGIGKTALLDDLVAGATGLRVVRATGFETETDLAFAGLASILGSFVPLIDRLPEPQARALAGALGVGPPLPPGDRFTAYAGTLSLLAEVALDGPMLVVVDDAHWLDEASLDALAFCARRIEAEGIGLVFAARREPPAAARRTSGMAVMHIDGLDEPAGIVLVSRGHRTPVSGTVARRLVADSHGNPLALIEAARVLTPAQLAGTEELPEHLPLGDDLARALAAGVAGLPEPTRAALLVAAAGAGDPGLVRDALGAEGIADALGAAESCGLIRLGASGVEFRHPLVRSGVYRAADLAERRRAHAALDRSGTSRGVAGTEVVARHRAAAVEGPDEDVAGALHEASRLAASRLGYAEAAALAQRAAALTPDPARRAARRIEAGGVAMLAGRPELARASLDEAIREATDPAVLSAARRARAHVETVTGSVARAREMLVREAEHLADEAPAAAAVLLFDAAIASGMAGDLREASAIARRAGACGDLPEPVAVVVRLLRASLSAMEGTADALDRLRAAPDPLRGLSDSDPLAWVRVGWCTQAFIWAEGASGDRAMARIIEQARAASAPTMLSYPLTVQASRRRLAGDLDGSLVTATEAAALADETGQTRIAAFARCQMAWVAAARGDAAQCRNLTGTALAMVEANGAVPLVPFTRSALGLLHLGLGDGEAACAELEAVRSTLTPTGSRSHLTITFASDLVEAAVRVGRADVAARALADLETMDQAGVAFTQGAVRRCHGLVEADHDRATHHLEAAVALEDRAGARFEAARSRLLLGERLLRTRERRRALAPLHEAFATFDRLGAVPWAGRATDALASLRARPGRVAGAAAAGLTSQELQVAHAASEGLTNKQIAARQFLSVKTVEFHLHNTYRKLGVRNRTELARRLHGDGGVGTG